MPDLLLAIAVLGLAWPALAFFALPRVSWLHPAKLYAMLFGLHVAVPCLLLALGFAPPFVNAANHPYLARAMIFSWLCLLALWLGAVVGGRLRFGPVPARPSSKNYVWRKAPLQLVLLLLLTAGWLTRAHVVQSDAYLQMQRAVQGELEGPLYALIRMVEGFPQYAVIMLVAFLADRHRRGLATSRTAYWLTLMLALVEFVYWVPTGRKEETILSILLPLVTLHLITGYIPPRKAIVGLFLFVLVLFPISHYYRLAVESNINLAGEVEREALLTLAQDTVTSGESSISPTNIVFNRVSMLEPISACMRLIDAGVWQPMLGESYAMLLISLVPRVLWPNKPQFDYGHEFGRVTGFLGVDDDETSISVTYIGESYLNFGWLGWLPMFVVAMFFAVLYRRTQNARDRATWTVLYVISLPSLLYFGGTFATYFGGLLKLIPFFYLICTAIRRSQTVNE